MIIPLIAPWKTKRKKDIFNTMQKKYNPNVELLKLVITGSVDDGKSTLIGRLLYDLGEIYEDQLESIRKTSIRQGKTEIDLSLLTDGLSAEREQKITIDVAYRYFSTPKRRYIIADVPGHEQYTRNMATGASNANLAIILVDARKGLLTQSKRHLFIASLMGVSHNLIVVNKMDLVDYGQGVFEKIKSDFIDFAAKLNIHDLQFIPVSALKGDMIVERGNNMNWYQGSTVASCLENLEIASDRNLLDFRFPVQLVIRPNQDFRGYAGQIEGGTIKIGEKVKILPSGQTSKIKSIIAGRENKEYAFSPQAAVLTLEDEVDVSRGDMIVRENNLAEVSDEFEAIICWMDSQPLSKGKSYILKQTTKEGRCFINKIFHRINIEDLHRETANVLELNDIGRIGIKTNEPVMFDIYSKNRNTGSFIIVDETTNNTVGAGIILRPVKKITPEEPLALKKGAVLWFTGLPSSGKSTLAEAVAQEFKKSGLPVERLDGDVVRETISRDLGFSAEDRQKNIERVTFIAKILARNGIMVLTSFISPQRKVREWARKEIGNFIEIYTKCPVEECIKRDSKGNYRKALAGEILNFTGVSDPYEEPESPEIVVETDKESVERCVEKIIKFLKKLGYLD